LIDDKLIIKICNRKNELQIYIKKYKKEKYCNFSGSYLNNREADSRKYKIRVWLILNIQTYRSIENQYVMVVCLLFQIYANIRQWQIFAYI